MSVQFKQQQSILRMWIAVQRGKREDRKHLQIIKRWVLRETGLQSTRGPLFFCFDSFLDCALYNYNYNEVDVTWKGQRSLTENKPITLYPVLEYWRGWVCLIWDPEQSSIQHYKSSCIQYMKYHYYRFANSTLPNSYSCNSMGSYDHF